MCFVLLASVANSIVGKTCFAEIVAQLRKSPIDSDMLLACQCRARENYSGTTSEFDLSNRARFEPVLLFNETLSLSLALW